MSRVAIPDILRKKQEGKKVTMLTAYDYPFAKIIDEAGMDIVLVGDSLGMVVQGHDTTLSVTMDEMLYHTHMVSRAVKNALVIADMPFLSNRMGLSETVRNAGRFLKEAGASGVKLRRSRCSGANSSDGPVRNPAMAHVGMTPQSTGLAVTKSRERKSRLLPKYSMTPRRLKKQAPLPWYWRRFPGSCSYYYESDLRFRRSESGPGLIAMGKCWCSMIFWVSLRICAQVREEYADLRTAALNAIGVTKEVESGTSLQRTKVTTVLKRNKLLTSLLRLCYFSSP